MASPRPGARGGYGRRRAPRPGDPADQRAWRRQRKRQHRGALRPGPRVPGGGGGGPGAPPGGGLCWAATRQLRASAAFPPRAPAEGRARYQDFARKSPIPSVALLKLDLPLSDHVGLSFAYLPVIDRKRVQDEMSNFLTVLFDRSGTRSLHQGLPNPQHSHTEPHSAIPPVSVFSSKETTYLAVWVL